MPRKSKPFIDKKKSTTYRLVHRSQRDVQDDTTTHVLVPSSPAMSVLNEKLASSGLTETFDYASLTKPIDESGVYYDVRGRSRPALDPRSRLVLEETKESERLLESIALSAACMEDDMALALYGEFSDGEFEEIQDDFCVAAAEPAEEEEGGFDYDAHVRDLISRAEKAAAGDVKPAEDDFFRGRESLREKRAGDEFGETEEDRLAMERKFEETMAEYDSDGVGDLEEEFDEIRGFRELEGDALLESALDEFLDEGKDEYYIDPKAQPTSFYGNMVGKDVILPEHLEKLSIEPKQSVKEVLKEADLILANPEMQPPEEDVLIDGKSYFSERQRSPWDCESILSTYSNMDNNPTVISRKKNNKIQPIQEYLPIQLSNKTGMPMGILPVTPKMETPDVSFNLGEARNKQETKEEKKARKEAIKQSRREARNRKKITKDAFQNEFIKRKEGIVLDSVGGSSVFRYT